MTTLAELMRPHLDAMWADHDPLVRRVARAVTAQIPSYARTPSSEVWIGMNRILERAAHGNPFAEPSEDDRLAAFGTGVQGAGAGISSEDLFAAVLLGAREVEADVLGRAASAGIPAEDLLEASRASRHWAEQVALWAAQGLVGADPGHTQRHVLEERLITALRHAAPSVEIDEHASALGLDVTRELYAAVALGANEVVPVTATALRLANPGGVWAVLPPGPGEPETIGLLVEVPRAPADLVVGVAGPAHVGLLTAALNEAGRAARVGRRFGLAGVVRLEDLGLLVPLHEDPALAQRLARRWIEPLRTEPRHELVATVRSWLQSDGQVDRVAREFGVHSNTVRNRLSRVAGLVGPDWRSPRHRAEIWAALQVSD